MVTHKPPRNITAMADQVLFLPYAVSELFLPFFGVCVWVFSGFMQMCFLFFFFLFLFFYVSKLLFLPYSVMVMAGRWMAAWFETFEYESWFN